MKKWMTVIVAALVLVALSDCGKSGSAVSHKATVGASALESAVPAQENDREDAPHSEAAETDSDGRNAQDASAEQETADETEETEDNAGLTNGMRPEFKEAMDSYESFYDEYCDFMKKYQEKPDDLSLLAGYAGMMARLNEMEQKFEAWDEEDLNNAELKYYIEVTGRISQKLLDAAQ